MRRDSAEIDERFAAYVRDRGDHHLRVAVLLTDDWHAAEDLVQTNLVKLYRACPRLDTPATRTPTCAASKVRMTFGDFGIRVSVSALPADETVSP
jgi:hypothetical protein